MPESLLLLRRLEVGFTFACPVHFHPFAVEPFMLLRNLIVPTNMAGVHTRVSLSH